MQMIGQRQLFVTPQQAWDALNNPDILQSSIPGCERFEAVSELEYEIVVAIKVGPVAARFKGKVTLADLNPPHAYVIHFDAQGGGAGFGKGSARVTLQPNDQGVMLEYQAESKLGGKLAQVGQRLIDMAAKSIAEDFFKRFERALSARYPAANIDSDLSVPSENVQLQNRKRKTALIVGAALIGLALIYLVQR